MKPAMGQRPTVADAVAREGILTSDESNAWRLSRVLDIIVDEMYVLFDYYGASEDPAVLDIKENLEKIAEELRVHNK